MFATFQAFADMSGFVEVQVCCAPAVALLIQIC